MEANKKRILYIGNNALRKTNYGSSIYLVSKLLRSEGYHVLISSSQKNIFFRLISMCFSILKNRNNVDYILIDTFSSLNFVSALFTSQLARLFNKNYIPILRGGNLPYRINKNPFLSGLIFNNSYINVAPSKYLKTEFAKRKYKTVMIPNVLEIDKYKYSKKKIIKPNILWVRAFKELYNPRLAVEVFTLVKEEFPEAKLCMIGPEKDNSFIEVQKKIFELNLEKSIELTGVLPKHVWQEKSKFFDIFINTTNFDNTPNSIIEGMALGLTIVSTNVGGMPYLIDNNIDGILVEKNNAHKMAKAIIDLIKENNLEYMKKARLKAESFGWENVKHLWFKILK